LHALLDKTIVSQVVKSNVRYIKATIPRTFSSNDFLSCFFVFFFLSLSFAHRLHFSAESNLSAKLFALTIYVVIDLRLALWLRAILCAVNRSQFDEGERNVSVLSTNCFARSKNNYAQHFFPPFLFLLLTTRKSRQ